MRVPGAAHWLAFSNPEYILKACCPGDVLPVLHGVQQAVDNEKLYAAGYVAYEAAPAFDAALVTHSAGEMPLAWFGLYRECRVLNPCPLGGEDTLDAPAWAPSVLRAAYVRAVRQIHQRLAAGETYQVNYTFPVYASYTGDETRLSRMMLSDPQAIYGAWLDLGRHVVASASPELFFELEGTQIRSRPMKGTAARGVTLGQDEARARCLHTSEKERAENVMIVDMIRNDLGRIARPGSVRVPHLFEVERYPTLWQMTSTVEAETTASLPEIFRALFPCASVTGAPKAKTMEIIAALESRPRGVYCGAIGYVTPNRRACFNVAIRTAVLDRHAGRIQYGVGSGVVWDSDANREYTECLLKARVLSPSRRDFQLLETMLWTPAEGILLLDFHLARLLASCTYFGVSVLRERVLEHLSRILGALPPQAHKVRLLVSLQGEITVQCCKWVRSSDAVPVRLRWARGPVDSGNPLLYHKTTNRDVYENARASRDDCDDVLLWNARGEVTETTVANLLLDRDGQTVTPAISSGLLPGTFRSWLLEQNAITEARVTIEDVMQSPRLQVVNALRQKRDAVLLDAAHPETF